MPASPTQHIYVQRINFLVDHINNHLDQKLDIAHLAALSHLSPFHFHRISSAVLGEPIGAFVARTRIETAAKLLRYTDQPVAEIAYAIGFESPTSLSRKFSAYFGLSPTAYRQNPSYKIVRQKQMKSSQSPDGPEFLQIHSIQVAYVRLTGDYMELDYGEAYQTLTNFARQNNLLDGIKSKIGISYDDPSVTDLTNCRYDVCFEIDKPFKSEGAVGRKEIAGGKYAVFTHKGPYDLLGNTYNYIYNEWLLNSEYELRNVPGFEQYLNDVETTEPINLITKIYIPLA